jgi:hypothetical protein
LCGQQGTKLVGQFAVFLIQENWAVLNHGHLYTEAMEHLRKLQTESSTTDNG